MIPVKTVDKVKMLKQVVNAETDAWIGMEDILKERQLYLERRQHHVN